MDYDKIDPFRYEEQYLKVPREIYLRNHWEPLKIDSIRNYSRNAVVLDLGCGYGHYLNMIEEAGARESVGLDISQRWIRCADHNRSSLILGSAEHLPFSEARFDFVIAFGLLEFVDNRKTINEISRVLVEGGHVAIMAPNRYGISKQIYRFILSIFRKEYRKRDPTLSGIIHDLGENNLIVEELIMNDFLVWLPDSVDRAIGIWLYEAMEWLSPFKKVNPLSSNIFILAKKEAQIANND